MNTALPESLLMTVFVGALMALLPHLSPRQYFFAITVMPGFRSSRAGQTAIRRYQAWVLAAVVLAGVAVATLGERWPNVAFGLAPALPAVISIVAFLRERARVAEHAAPPSGVREAALTPGADHLPRWIWMALPPFAAPLAAAAWLRAHWDEIPARFAVHWDASNQPDRWADKSPHAVYGPLLYGGGLLLMILLMSLAMFHGARRGPQRLAVLKIMVATMYLLAVVFTAIALMPVANFSPMWLLAPTGVFLLVVVIWVFRLVRDPQMPADATPDRCWHLGMVSRNSQDPSLFVQKRMGFGYTFNFGNPLAWLLIGSLVAGLVGLTLVLP